MDENISIRQWIQNYDSGMYNNPSRETMGNAGWYDWFCDDETLFPRLQGLAPIVKHIAQSPKINIDTMYVWFKNNCPLAGELYDDIRIADKETGDVLYTFAPWEGYDISKGNASLWGYENKFDRPLAEGSIRSVFRFFGVDPDFDVNLFIDDSEPEYDDYYEEDEEEYWEDEEEIDDEEEEDSDY